MAGTIPLSMTQQLDVYGEPLSGGQLYIIQAGTVSTPKNAYQDSGLTILMPYPMTLDAAGRIPQFFLDDSVSNLCKIRLQDSTGVIQLSADNVLIIGPSVSGGGGGGATIDPTTIYQTGDLKPRYGTGLHDGWVRANGRTIGSASSGATERANADTQSLFTHLWTADSALAVSGGRGASAAADWSGNKNIATPDFRGRALAGLDDMGSSAAGRLTLTYFGVAATALGAAGGGESKTLATANLPPYTPAGTIANGAITITNDAPKRTISTGSGADGGFGFPASGSIADITASQATSTFGGTAQGGSSTPFATVPPTMLATIYIKL